jgi:hypothetical protein
LRWGEAGSLTCNSEAEYELANCIECRSAPAGIAERAFFVLGRNPAMRLRDEYSEKETKARFEAALKGDERTPHKPLEDKPKVKRQQRKKQRLTRESRAT